jgi:hypothetical protein
MEEYYTKQTGKQTDERYPIMGNELSRRKGH